MIPWNDFIVDSDLMSKIKAAFDRSGSDKSVHHYERVYQHFLSELPQVKRILEFGISNYPHESERNCGSLFAWSSLYPNSVIYGADSIKDRIFWRENIHTFVVDQASGFELRRFNDDKLAGKEFEIIVDDASHVFAHSRQTFETLLNRVSLDGCYFVEDVAKQANGWQQTVADWDEYLRAGGRHYYIVDAWPENPADVDSVMVCICK
jgi:hypothetical protein